MVGGNPCKAFVCRDTLATLELFNALGEVVKSSVGVYLYRRVFGYAWRDAHGRCGR